MSRLKAVLLASVALNLFTLGAISSFWITRPPPPPFPHGGGGDPVRGPLVSPRDLDTLLSPEGQKVRDEILLSSREHFHQSIEALLAARRNVLEVAREDPLSNERLEKALEEMQARDQALTDSAHQAIRALLPQLSVEDRRRLAQAGLERMRLPPLPPGGGRPE